jgi:hypothetical protein
MFGWIKTSALWTWRSGLPSIPIIGPLTKCAPRHHLKALREFSVILCFSTATFWLTALFLRGFVRNKDADLFQLLNQTVSTGQLFIFSVGFLGPILLAAGDDRSRKRVFPGRISHFLVLFLLGTAAAGFYALRLTGAVFAPMEIIDEAYLFATSVWIAIFSVTLRYLTMVYKNLVEDFDPETEMKAPTEDFAEAFAKRHSSGAGA